MQYNQIVLISTILVLAANILLEVGIKLAHKRYGHPLTFRAYKSDMYTCVFSFRFAFLIGAAYSFILYCFY